MGVLLRVRSDTGEDCPISYDGRADPKLFCWAMSAYPDPQSEVARLLSFFHLDLEPFQHRTGEEYSLEQWLSPFFKPMGDWDDHSQEEKIQAWHVHQAEIEEAYLDPAAFLSALNPFIVALATRPTVYEEIGFTNPYFTEGGFLYHLQDLKREFEWAQSRGIKRVRLVIA